MSNTCQRCESVSEVKAALKKGLVCKTSNSIILDHPSHIHDYIDHFKTCFTNVCLHIGKPSSNDETRSTMGTYLQRLETHGKVSQDWFTENEEKPGLLRAVLNCRRLRQFKITCKREFSKTWSTVVNFLWIGPSPGQLHFDEFDNVLCQLQGQKSVLIYDPAHTFLIDGAHYPAGIRGTGFLSEASLRDSPWLRDIPYRIVDLKPGEAVAIPAFAYHAPLARSVDSVSCNAFLVPSLFDCFAQNTWPAKCQGSLKFGIFLLKSWVLLITNRLRILCGEQPLAIGPYEFF
mmetsp:Transcript_17892/g.61004  ORF Transcript_17892/g.61004 Transcript_17892/m.61004 type:complete len:289 (+) Transcript_17892:206-1072(+)